MLAILLVLGLFQSLQDEYVLRLHAFDRAYETYKLDLLGCPERFKKQAEPLDIRLCSPANGSINVKEWLAARKEAKKLWGLVEGADQ